MTPESFVIEQLFQIINKDLQVVPFQLNAAQRMIDAKWDKRNVVPKARQEGVSSWVLARFTVVCMSVPNARCVVISHEKEATERLLDKVDFYLKNLKSPPAVMSTESKAELRFKKTGATFYIGTAGAKAFGRGDMISHLHCSEVAYWPDPQRLVTGLFQAVPTNGEINVESTGNGRGNFYHRLCMRAYEGKSRFKLHFLPWHIFPEYSLPVTEEEGDALMRSLLPELEEPEDVKAYNLTPGQVAWRRMKLEELEYDLANFRQEYPACLLDCFRASGRSIFDKVNYQETEQWKRRSETDYDLFILGDHPKPSGRYAIGADVSAGVGGDNSVAQIVDLDANEQVGEWASNRHDPAVFASKLAKFGKMFNMAYITVESNNHGILTLRDLRDLYPSYLIYRSGAASGQTDLSRLSSLGVATTGRSKPLMIGHAKTLLRQGFIIHSPALKHELDVFCETESGKLEAQEGEHDDRVLALVMALFSKNKADMQIEVPRAPAPLVQSYSVGDFNTMLRELENRSSGYFPVANPIL